MQRSTKEEQTATALLDLTRLATLLLLKYLLNRDKRTVKRKSSRNIRIFLAMFCDYNFFSDHLSGTFLNAFWKSRCIILTVFVSS